MLWAFDLRCKTSGRRSIDDVGVEYDARQRSATGGVTWVTRRRNGGPACFDRSGLGKDVMQLMKAGSAILVAVLMAGAVAARAREEADPDAAGLEYYEKRRRAVVAEQWY